jgi:hypothetical protein
MKEIDPKNIEIDKAGNITVKNISGSDVIVNLGNSKEVKEFLESIRDQINELPAKVLLELVKAGYGLNTDFRTHDVQIEFESRKGDNILRPKFLKKMTLFKLKPQTDNSQGIPSFGKLEFVKVTGGMFGTSKINHGLCRLRVLIFNSGQLALKNWKVWLYFEQKEVSRVDDCYPKGLAGLGSIDNRTVFAYEENLAVLYKPLDNILIQKDSKSFECLCLPQFDAQEVTVRIHLLAEDFDFEDQFTFEIQKSYHEEENIKWVKDESQIQTTEEITDYITEE